MTVSAFSGVPINPDAEAELIIRIPGARERRLVVTASEADSFAEMGEPVPGLLGGMWAKKRTWKKWFWWLLGAVVASLILPAATKQWPDQQAALTLRSELISEISESTVSMVVDAQGVLNSPDEEEARAARDDVFAVWSIQQRASIHSMPTLRMRQWLLSGTNTAHG